MSRSLVWLATDFRDGLQGEGIEVTNLSSALRAVGAIDRLGVAYHELGFATQSQAQERIRAARELELNGKVAAFGRTHQDDVQAIINLGVPVAVVVGKTRQRDAERSLRVTPGQNLDFIRRTVAELKARGLEVVYDAEHAFDALNNGDTKYALSTIMAAYAEGADWIVLCDTNGGSLTSEIETGINLVNESGQGSKLGFHGHDDCGLAVANSLAAFSLGVSHIQGCTLPGFGERCGNAPLAVLLPNLVTRFGVDGQFAKRLSELTHTCHVVADAFNTAVPPKTPWVGSSAFYTAAGMHQSGLERDPGSYLHSDPDLVGNRVRVGLSEQSGRASLAAKVRERLGMELNGDELQGIFALYTKLVGRGMNFGLADASFELFVLRYFRLIPVNLEFLQWRLHIEKEQGSRVETEASLRLSMSDESDPGKRRKLHNADGDGPVNALDNALRRTLKSHYPSVLYVRLTDFTVRMLELARGSASKVRVLITFADQDKSWTTTAVDENILEACWEALWDGYVYKLCKG